MKPRLLNLITVISMLLCLASAVMWVHSEFIWLQFHRISAPDSSGNVRWLGLSSCNGRFSLCKHEHDPSQSPGPQRYTLRKAATPADPWTWLAGRSPDGGFCLAGFYFVHSTGALEMHFFSIPYYVFVLLFLALPLRRWLKKRALKPGCCPRCGYDLRATPERCPECGTAPPKDQVQAAPVPSSPT